MRKIQSPSIRSNKGQRHHESRYQRSRDKAYKEHDTQMAISSMSAGRSHERNEVSSIEAFESTNRHNQNDHSVSAALSTYHATLPGSELPISAESVLRFETTSQQVIGFLLLSTAIWTVLEKFPKAGATSSVRPPQVFDDPTRFDDLPSEQPNTSSRVFCVSNQHIGLLKYQHYVSYDEGVRPANILPRIEWSKTSPNKTCTKDAMNHLEHAKLSRGMAQKVVTNSLALFDLKLIETPKAIAEGFESYGIDESVDQLIQRALKQNADAQLDILDGENRPLLVALNDHCFRTSSFVMVPQDVRKISQKGMHELYIALIQGFKKLPDEFTLPSPEFMCLQSLFSRPPFHRKVHLQTVTQDRPLPPVMPETTKKRFYQLPLVYQTAAQKASESGRERCFTISPEVTQAQLGKSEAPFLMGFMPQEMASDYQDRLFGQTAPKIRCFSTAEPASLNSFLDSAATLNSLATLETINAIMHGNSTPIESLVSFTREYGPFLLPNSLALNTFLRFSVSFHQKAWNNDTIIKVGNAVYRGAHHEHSLSELIENAEADGREFTQSFLTQYKSIKDAQYAEESAKKFYGPIIFGFFAVVGLSIIYGPAVYAFCRKHLYTYRFKEMFDRHPDWCITVELKEGQIILTEKNQHGISVMPSLCESITQCFPVDGYALGTHRVIISTLPKSRVGLSAVEQTILDYVVAQKEGRQKRIEEENERKKKEAKDAEAVEELRRKTQQAQDQEAKKAAAEKEVQKQKQENDRKEREKLQKEAEAARNKKKAENKRRAKEKKKVEEEKNRAEKPKEKAEEEKKIQRAEQEKEKTEANANKPEKAKESSLRQRRTPREEKDKERNTAGANDKQNIEIKTSEDEKKPPKIVFIPAKASSSAALGSTSSSATVHTLTSDSQVSRSQKAEVKESKEAKEAKEAKGSLVRKPPKERGSAPLKEAKEIHARMIRRSFFHLMSIKVILGIPLSCSQDPTKVDKQKEAEQQLQIRELAIRFHLLQIFLAFKEAKVIEKSTEDVFIDLRLFLAHRSWEFLPTIEKTGKSLLESKPLQNFYDTYKNRVKSTTPVTLGDFIEQAWDRRPSETQTPANYFADVLSLPTCSRGQSQSMSDAIKETPLWKAVEEYNSSMESASQGLRDGWKALQTDWIPLMLTLADQLFKPGRQINEWTADFYLPEFDALLMLIICSGELFPSFRKPEFKSVPQLVSFEDANRGVLCRFLRACNGMRNQMTHKVISTTHQTSVSLFQRIGKGIVPLLRKLRPLDVSSMPVPLSASQSTALTNVTTVAMSAKSVAVPSASAASSRFTPPSHLGVLSVSSASSFGSFSRSSNASSSSSSSSSGMPSGSGVGTFFATATDPTGNVWTPMAAASVQQASNASTAQSASESRSLNPYAPAVKPQKQ